MLRKNRNRRGGRRIPKNEIINRARSKGIPVQRFKFKGKVLQTGSLNDFQTVVFYNFCANGDIHVSRSYVKALMPYFAGRTVVYQHHNSHRLLLDIPNLTTTGLTLPKTFRYSGWGIQNKTLFINTWYMTNRAQYYRGTGCSIYTLDNMFRGELYRSLKIALPLTIHDCIPSIDYSYFDAQNLEQKIKNLPNPDKLILISNGNVTSKQAQNFDFNPIINCLADKYPQHTYLVTNYPKIINKKNVFYTRDIIGRNDCDLNENAYLTRFCKAVIGRSSGTFTFSVANKDLWTHPNRKFICFVYPHCRSAAFFGLENMNKTNQFMYSPAVTWEQALTAIDTNIVTI